MRDRRQSVETLIRGVVPIGFGLHPIIMADFVKEGLADHVKKLDFFAYGGGEVTAIYNNAPHPKAGKLFINWLLTKEGQGSGEERQSDSARLMLKPWIRLRRPAPANCRSHK